MNNRIQVSLQENGIIIPSYQHYGGSSGLHDYGVIGTIIKNKLLNIWKNTFLSDDVVEIEANNMMTKKILQASGHFERFNDYIVEDDNGISYRADHIVENYVLNNDIHNINVDSMSKDELEIFINKHKIITRKDGKTVKVNEKNLMYAINNDDYLLRPELAQGIFVNFDIIKTSSKLKIPFGIAQIGKSYRNEISPKPMTRLREFTQAEIEYFYDPINVDNDDLSLNENILVTILDKQNMCHNITMHEAFERGIIKNKIIAHYISKINTFCLNIGLKRDKIRFRQHKDNELSHYSTECWDLETLIFDSWLECIGCADRGCYDLRAHNITTKRKLQKPTKENIITTNLNKKEMFKKYGRNTNDIANYLSNLEQNELMHLCDASEFEININGQIFTIDNKTANFKTQEKMKEYEDYYPCVVEPSFGIDRLLYSIFVQNYYERKENKKRLVLSLPNTLTPYDIAVFRLHNGDSEMKEKMDKILKNLRMRNIKCYIDESSTAIGKKYVRSDEIGVKYAITVDQKTVSNDKILFRYRDSMQQIEIGVKDIYDYLMDQMLN